MVGLSSEVRESNEVVWASFLYEAAARVTFDVPAVGCSTDLTVLLWMVVCLMWDVPTEASLGMFVISSR